MTTDTQHHWPLWSLFVAVAIGGFFYVIGQQLASDSVSVPTISASGVGKEYIAPDIAELNFGVTTGRQRTAEAAINVLKERMDAIITSAKTSGIADKDMQTQSLWLNPTYDWIDGRQTNPAFEATQNLVVKVRDIAKVGDILTAATRAGANQIGGVNFTVDNPDATREKARQVAIQKAKEQAQKLANELGVSLGALQSYSESFGDQTGTTMYRGEGMGGGGADLSVPSGQQEVVVTVYLNYKIR